MNSILYRGRHCKCQIILLLLRTRQALLLNWSIRALVFFVLKQTLCWRVNIQLLCFLKITFHFFVNYLSSRLKQIFFDLTFQCCWNIRTVLNLAVSWLLNGRLLTHCCFWYWAELLLSQLGLFCLNLLMLYCQDCFLFWNVLDWFCLVKSWIARGRCFLFWVTMIFIQIPSGGGQEHFHLVVFPFYSLEVLLEIRLCAVMARLYLIEKGWVVLLKIKLSCWLQLFVCLEIDVLRLGIQLFGCENESLTERGEFIF